MQRVHGGLTKEGMSERDGFFVASWFTYKEQLVQTSGENQCGAEFRPVRIWASLTNC